MKKVSYIGPDDEYSSHDAETGQPVLLRKGEPPVEVSDAKCEQMVADFPGWFKVEKQAAKKPAST